MPVCVIAFVIGLGMVISGVGLLIAAAPSVISPESEAGLAERLAQYERRIIADVLEQEKHNRTRTAARLGITRKTLLSKISTYGLDRNSD